MLYGLSNASTLSNNGKLLRVSALGQGHAKTHKQQDSVAWALLVLGRWRGWRGAGGGGGRDLFTRRYTGYGRSQGVVTPSFFKCNIKGPFKRKQARDAKKRKPDGLNFYSKNKVE